MATHREEHDNVVEVFFLVVWDHSKGCCGDCVVVWAHCYHPFAVVCSLLIPLVAFRMHCILIVMMRKFEEKYSCHIETMAMTMALHSIRLIPLSNRNGISVFVANRYLHIVCDDNPAEWPWEWDRWLLRLNWPFLFNQKTMLMDKKLAILSKWICWIAR